MELRQIEMYVQNQSLDQELNQGLPMPRPSGLKPEAQLSAPSTPVNSEKQKSIVLGVPGEGLQMEEGVAE